jgi:hypothetical protein
MDGATVTRSHCSGCPSFVSFRITNERAMVGCDWGDDVTGWLRREMRAGGSSAERRPEGRPAAVRAADRPIHPLRRGDIRPSQPLRHGSPIGFFLAAFGLGIALTAWDRAS